MQISFKEWTRKGNPWIWLNAAAVSVSLIAVLGLMLLIMARGLVHFWPHSLIQADYVLEGKEPVPVIGEVAQREDIPTEQLKAAGYPVKADEDFMTRILLKTGNRDVLGSDFRWVLEGSLKNVRYPETLITLERREWGNYYGYQVAYKNNGTVVANAQESGDKTWELLIAGIARADALNAQIEEIEKGEIGKVNYELERLRLTEKRLQLEGKATDSALAELEAERQLLHKDYERLQAQLGELYTEIGRDTVVMRAMNGQETEISVSKIVRAFQPNKMGLIEKIGHYGMKLGEFVGDDPREANTEGGVFPAIYGTVLMVLIMSIMVTPLGVIAAVYLREYANQGALTQTIRIAVNNLAGVPAIVYGVFGLGFFVYFLGGNIDRLFYPEALPSPTFGTGGLMWASITLAILTLPVVIVATEEGLARIPRSIREGSLALGATKAETLWRVVLPMASPAMMTGMILAIARAAGEVAPLMLVGVVKLAPSLPLDGNYPFLHLDQKFMHLGFHIYDVGFQSPNVEAARPLVYATSLLLVLVIALLNLAAVGIRNHLREKYKALEM
jgi:phosphate transport system permease protein